MAHAPCGARYIVDFVAPARRIVVEIDGSFHEQRRRGRTGARRNAALVSAGYRVLRPDAALVVRALAIAVQRVRDAVIASMVLCRTSGLTQPPHV